MHHVSMQESCADQPDILPVIGDRAYIEFIFLEQRLVAEGNKTYKGRSRDNNNQY
jgi:hypothetical protein